MAEQQRCYHPPRPEKSPGAPCRICGELTLTCWTEQVDDLTEWIEIPCSGDCMVKVGADLVRDFLRENQSGLEN